LTKKNKGWLLKEVMNKRLLYCGGIRYPKGFFRALHENHKREVLTAYENPTKSKEIG